MVTGAGKSVLGVIFDSLLPARLKPDGIQACLRGRFLGVEASGPSQC